MSKQRGFTVPELLVVMILTGTLTSLILVFTFSYWRYGFTTELDLDSFVDRLNASDYLRESIGSSSGLITQNSLSDSHPGTIDPYITPANFWLPLHAVPGTKSHAVAPETVTPVLYYKRYSLDSTNTVILNGLLAYEDEFIVYMDKPTRQLRVRTLANPAAVGNRLTTSCPPEHVTASCPTDRVLMSNIESVETRYFSKSGALLDWTSITDPALVTAENPNGHAGPDNPVVEVVEIKLNVLARAKFQTVDNTKNSTIIRIALRNT